MKQSWAITMLKLTSMTILTYAAVSIAEEEPPPPTVKVGVYARHLGGRIVYHYRVINNLPQTIDAVTIGRDSKGDEVPDNDAW